MSRTSVKAMVTMAKRTDDQLRKKLATGDGVPALAPVATLDSFINFQHKLGIGADNPLSTASYGFNPITRNRNLLEWIHRGSWLGGVAVDVLADDMTRGGVDMLGQLAPDAGELLQKAATSMGVWSTINEGLRWGRLYGGSIVIALIDGQDLRQPLRLQGVTRGQFKGLLTLDRWMVDPTLEDLVTDFGPHLGLPKYYRVQTNAPALRGQAVHHSRVMIRHVGIELPYQQRLIENLWGLSVLERLYDRMIAFDSASTGMAQLIYKSYIRTLKVKNLREVVAQGGKALDGLTAYVDMMRRFQGIEGMTVIDGDDEVDVQQHSAMTGMSDALDRFGQQIAGALQMPLTRLFGVSGGGLNGTNDSDMRLYYDQVRQRQIKDMQTGVTNIHRLIAASEGIQLPPDFSIEFRSLWELSDGDKATIAGQVTTAVTKAMEDGVIGQKTALKELKQSSRRTGIFTNITDEMITLATDDTGPPPSAEGDMLPGMTPEQAGEQDETVGPQGNPGAVGGIPRRRAQLQLPAAGGRTPDQPAGAGDESGR